MFNKITSFTIDRNSVEVLDNELVKTASEIILPEGHMYDPDFVYMKVRAVSAGEYWGCNKNADFFPEEELKKNYKTFFDAHVFKNHENKEVEKAIGDVLDATWNDEMKYVELFIRVDRRIAPTIARGFEKGFMTDVSMGCKIDHSICSICGNLAKTQAQYCDHIKREKHRVYDDGRKVYEININPRFHDISAVLNGADRTAKMTGLFISGTKVASFGMDEMEKCASTLEDALFDEPTNSFNSYSAQAKHQAHSEIYDELPLFSKTASTKVTKQASEVEKIAEMKKQIKGNILAVAKSRAELSMKDKEEHRYNEMRANGDIPVLTSGMINRFAKGINEVSDKEEVMAEQVFTTALRMLSLAGVNLSPLEFVQVMRRVIGIPRRETVRSCPAHGGNKIRIIKQFDHRLNTGRDLIQGVNLPTMLNLVNATRSRSHSLPIIEGRGATAPAMIVIKKISGVNGIARPVLDNLNLEDKVLKIASEVIETKSLHLPHMTKRAMDVELELEKCALSKLCTTCSYAGSDVYARTNSGFTKTDRQDRDAEYVKCSKNNNEMKAKGDVCGEYEAKKTEKQASETLLDHYYDYYTGSSTEKVASEDVFNEIEHFAYASYQNMVADYLTSKDYNSDLYRFASEIGVDDQSMEKCAKHMMKSMNAGLGTYMYSKYQGVKTREGKPQSTLNRTMAENPVASALGASVITKSLLKNSDKLKKGAGKALKYVAKTASENIGIYLNGELEKTADTLADIDIFKDSVIDVKMAREYTPQQIKMIKIASVVYAQGRQDICDNVLATEGLGYDSLNNYLQICEDTLTEELEKKNFTI